MYNKRLAKVEKKTLKILTILLLSLLPMTLLADPVFDDIEKDQHVPRKGENWKEPKLTLDGMPAYPRDSDLRKLKIRNSTSSFYVDIASITSSKKDNTPRMVTVVISPHGARTVTYEGFDCGYKRFKKYGYAGSDGPIRAFEEQAWQPVVDVGNGRYRADLIDHYLCANMSYAASRGKILKRMNSLKPYKKKD